ncbi:hypothetical protein Ocin01_06915, partial [Orchesella cincta]
MSKTQMFQRAKNTFLKMNLTPYLTDLMEARTYLEGIINQEEVKSINLHVPVLENFSRDDERLDLVHAIARMKEWSYMEDFDDIVKETSYGKKLDNASKIKLQIAASQTHDLKNASANKHLIPEQEISDDLALWTARQSFSIKDLFTADPTLFHTVASFSHLQNRSPKHNNSMAKANGSVSAESQRNSEVAFHHKRMVKRRKSANSMPSLPSLLRMLVKQRIANLRESGVSTTKTGQRLTDFRKKFLKADRFSDASEKELSPIVTLKQLRRSFQANSLTEM